MKFIYIFVCIVGLYGCQNKTSIPLVKAEKIVERFKGKTLLYPDSVSCLFFNMREVDSIKYSALKVVTFVDGDCSVCISKLNYWKRFTTSLYREKRIHLPVLIYAYARKGEFFRDITEELNYKGVWLFDPEQRFSTLNHMWDARLQTVLVDKDQKIMIIGDPVFNEKMEDLYRETIVKFYSK